MTKEYAFAKRPTRLVPIAGTNNRAEAFEKTDGELKKQRDEIKGRKKARKEKNVRNTNKVKVKNSF